MDDKTQGDEGAAKPSMDHGCIEGMVGDEGGGQTETDTRRNRMDQAAVDGEVVEQNEYAVTKQQETAQPQHQQFHQRIALAKGEDQQKPRHHRQRREGDADRDRVRRIDVGQQAADHPQHEIADHRLMREHPGHRQRGGGHAADRHRAHQMGVEIRHPSTP